MLLRGKDFDGIAILTNTEKRTLLGGTSLNKDTEDEQRKLNFELQMKEREFERMKSSVPDDSDLPNVQIDR